MVSSAVAFQMKGFGSTFQWSVQWMMALARSATEVNRPRRSRGNDELYNRLFTKRDAIMLSLFATGLSLVWAMQLWPIDIGAPDVAFPPAEYALLLVFLVQRPDRRWLPDAEDVADFGWFTNATERRLEEPERRRGHCGSRGCGWLVWVQFWRWSTS
jgi:hypothetical protein